MTYASAEVCGPETPGWLVKYEPMNRPRFSSSSVKRRWTHCRYTQGVLWDHRAVSLDNIYAPALRLKVRWNHSMASIGEFTRRFAKITGLPEGSVVKFSRELRDGGLLTTGARGVNAPEMTFLDAARMLVAVLATDRPSRAAKVVRDFGSLKTWTVIPNSKHSEFALVRCGLTDDHTLEQAIAAAIQIFAWHADEPFFTHAALGQKGEQPPVLLGVEANELVAYLELPGCKYDYSDPSLVQMAKEMPSSKFISAMQALEPGSTQWPLHKRPFDRADDYRRPMRVIREVYAEVLADLGDLFRDDSK